ncbi:MAG TPA: chemotaxis response regulator protein-glutamate methylesterase [Polyangiales bacterium]
MAKKVRVLVVDDSATVRKTLTEILESDPLISVMATAADPLIAAERMRHEVPDVITLDVEMPRMDGLTFLDKIMTQHPIPVVICSSFTERGSQTALDALERGAIDVISKPQSGTEQFLRDSAIRICEAVKAAALARPARRVRAELGAIQSLSADVMLPKPKPNIPHHTTDRVVAIGASTGGTEALAQLLRVLPADAPGILIVQHMPEKFTASFAHRLDSLCAIHVREARDGDPVLRGQALLSPGNVHMLLRSSGTRYFVEIKDGPLVSRHRPAVDVLFRSTARYAGSNAIGVILTGMGNDGAQGMLEMKQAGAFNIAQDQRTCVVFGMPNEAIKCGAVDAVLPLDQIAGEIMRSA